HPQHAHEGREEKHGPAARAARTPARVIAGGGIRRGVAALVVIGAIIAIITIMAITTITTIMRSALCRHRRGAVYGKTASGGDTPDGLYELRAPDLMAQTRTATGARDASDARIGSAGRVRGRIPGPGNPLVEGDVEGNVTLRGDLTIAEGATVTSEAISAQAVHIAGSLEGNVTASGAVRLAAGARVRGDLQGSSIVIDDGARFSGKLDCEFDLPPELGGASQGEARGRASNVSGARR